MQADASSIHMGNIKVERKWDARNKKQKSELQRSSSKMDSDMEAKVLKQNMYGCFPADAFLDPETLAPHPTPELAKALIPRAKRWPKTYPMLNTRQSRIRFL